MSRKQLIKGRTSIISTALHLPIKAFLFCFISLKLLIGEIGKMLGLVHRATDVYREATIKKPEPMVIEGDRDPNHRASVDRESALQSVARPYVSTSTDDLKRDLSSNVLRPVDEGIILTPHQQDSD